MLTIRSMTLAIALLIAVTGTSFAQIQELFLEVDGIAMPLTDFKETTVTSADGKPVHEINATGPMRNAFSVVRILIEKMSSPTNAQGGSIVSVRTFLDGSPGNVRQFAGCTIAELKLGELNPLSQEPLLIEIRIVSRTANTSPGTRSPVELTPGEKELLSEGFDLRIDGLPPNVIRTKSLSIVPCPATGCVMSAVFEIGVNGDKRAAWNDWLTNEPTNLRNGVLRLRHLAGNVTFGKLLLYDVRPTSYNEITTATGSEATVGLSVAKVYLR